MEQLEARASITSRNSGVRTSTMPDDIASISNGVSGSGPLIILNWLVANSALFTVRICQDSSPILEKSVSEKTIVLPRDLPQDAAYTSRIPGRHRLSKANQLSHV